MTDLEPILECREVSVTFNTHEGRFQAVDDFSLSIKKGEIVGLVGESGCGKSISALSFIGLLPERGSITKGEVYFRGEPLTRKSEKAFQKIRGNQISMIFQEPMTSLNPVYKIGRQMTEQLLLHNIARKSNVRDMAVKTLSSVGVSAPEQRLSEYPHQLSGGLRQRVMIAMAIGCNPSLLIADEPTTALDVTIQAQILELIKSIVQKNQMSVLFITHDLGVVAETCDRVVVMYAGKKIEEASVDELFAKPLHPYTVGLMQSIPQIDKVLDVLNVIPGTVPSLQELSPDCCRFYPRCLKAMPVCQNREPPFVQPADESHGVSCHLYTA